MRTIYMYTIEAYSRNGTKRCQLVHEHLTCITRPLKGGKEKFNSQIFNSVWTNVALVY